MMQEQQYMARALQLAQRGRFTTSPNPNVGCVIVKDGRIVGEGFHRRAGEAHAEVEALQSAGAAAQGATVYVTLEPCSHYGRTPPCAKTLIEHGIKRVVVAMKDPNPQVAGCGLAMLSQAGIDVVCGVLETEAEQLNRGFLKRMRTGLPYVQLKLAASLDGRTAMASGESKWITSPLARQDVQRFRAQSSAILSTSSTVLADNPSLTVRWSELPSLVQRDYPQNSLRQPIRIVLDRHNRVTSEHKLIEQPGETWLLRYQPGAERWPDSVQQLQITSSSTELEGIMRLLAARQINQLWTECGATLAGALIQAGLVDELIVYLAPKLLGNEAKGLCNLPGLYSLSAAPEFKITDVTQIGPDIRLTLKHK